MRKFNLFFRLAIIVAILLTAFAVSHPTEVKAQSGTTITILPANPTVCLHDTVTMAVWVNNVVNLYGMDLWLNFDPGNVEVLSITQGPFLDSGWTFFNEYNNDTGSIHYTMTQLYPSTAKTGSGILLYIEMRVNYMSATPINVTIDTTSTNPTQISAQYGALIPFTAQNATINTSLCTAPVGISPANSMAFVCYQTTVSVRITDVNKLYGFSLDLTFDPNVIQVVSVSNGGFLTYGTPFLNIFNNTTGTINYAAFQIAPTEPKSGSGNLINIKVIGKTYGASTPLNILNSSVLTDRNSWEISSSLSGGMITVSPDCNPTEVKIKYLKTNRKPYAATVSWQTVSDEEVLYFNVYRSWNKSGSPKTLLTKSPIPVIMDGTLNGHRYSFIDKGLKPSKDYYYWLEAVDTSMVSKIFGPVIAKRTVNAIAQ